ncbi:hypothetical protein BGY98DRAFT_1036327, partial [Russula aff. rugulosa BPL654]
MQPTRSLLITPRLHMPRTLYPTPCIHKSPTTSHHYASYTSPPLPLFVARGPSPSQN